MKAEFPLEITGLAFLLRPDVPPEGSPRPSQPGETEPGVLREPLRTAAQEAGLVKMRRPSRISSSLLALQATEYAKEQGNFQEFHKACYQAYWEEQEDLGRWEVLEAVAKRCELDWTELKERLEAQHYREAVLKQNLQARKLGIEAIPTFVIGNLLFSGAAPYDAFRQVTLRYLSQGATQPSP